MERSLQGAGALLAKLQATKRRKSVPQAENSLTIYEQKRGRSITKPYQK
jgi:hypothetical protein